jgi:predicted Na+-dependent transporter
MKSLIMEVFGIVTPLTIALIVFAQGLSVAPSQVATFFREQPALMLRSLFSVLVLVPAAALVLILALKPAAGVAIGLAILVSCAPAPIMFKTAPGVGGGNAAFMASLHLSLAALAFVTVPTVLFLVSIPLGFHANVDLGAMAWILARTILLPIGVAMAVRAFFPKFAAGAAPILAKVANIGLVAVLVVVLAATYHTLLNMDAWSYFVMVVVAAAALAIGHLSGPRDPHQKTITAIECAVRHPVLSLTIGGANFGPQKAMAVLIPCVLTVIAVAFVYMIWRGRAQTGVRDKPIA